MLVKHLNQKYMKKVMIIALAGSLSILSSCAGSVQVDAETICECWKEAESKDPSKTFDDCRELEKEIREKYKDDDDALQEMEDALNEGCAASR